MSDILSNYINDKSTTHILNKYIYAFMKYLNSNEKLDSSKKLNQKTLYLHIKYVELFDRYLYYYHQTLDLRY